MIASAAVAATMLHCFFSRPTDGSVPADSLPVIRAPLPQQIAADMAAGRVSVSDNHFAGEAAGSREWSFAGRPAPGASSVKILRVTLEGPGSSLPSPYRARYGTATFAAAGGQPTFQTELTGYCQLKPAGESVK